MSPTHTPRLRKSDYLLMLFHKLGVFNFVRKLTPNTLTVLNYHRIDEPYRSSFDTFRPNVSATPSRFARQMNYVAHNYHVISGTDLVTFIKQRKKLPARAALITFDDGYLDNYTNAYPILKVRNLPAIIFLVTDYIGTNKLLYWDLIAYCFQHTSRDHAQLPNLGLQTWVDEQTREKVMLTWIEMLKKLPESEKQAIVDRLPEVLGVSVSDRAITKLMISWSQAREMSENNIEMGGHTASHPILTRIPLQEVALELSKSKHCMEEELGKPVLSFAYPNGQLADFNTDVMAQVGQVGFEVAFTLLSGPTRYQTVAKNPLSIRRIFLSHEDHFSRFVAKLAGVPRIIPHW